MEYFIEKYIPIHTAQTIEAFLSETLPERQQRLLEIFYMKKTKDLTESLLVDEKDIDLKKKSIKIFKELE